MKIGGNRLDGGGGSDEDGKVRVGLVGRLVSAGAGLAARLPRAPNPLAHKLPIRPATLVFLLSVRVGLPLLPPSIVDVEEERELLVNERVRVGWTGGGPPFIFASEGSFHT